MFVCVYNVACPCIPCGPTTLVTFVFKAYSFNGFLVVYFVNPLPSLFVELLCGLVCLFNLIYPISDKLFVYVLSALFKFWSLYVFLVYLTNPLSSLFVELAPLWFVCSTSQPPNQTIKHILPNYIFMVYVFVVGKLYLL